MAVVCAQRSARLAASAGRGSIWPVGLQSEERLAARIEADAAAMRQHGYLVASVQTFALPVVGARRHAANWYRVTYELQAAARHDADPRKEIP